MTRDQEALLLTTARTLRLLVEVRLKAAIDTRVKLTEAQWAVELDKLTHALEPFTLERDEADSNEAAEVKPGFQARVS